MRVLLRNIAIIVTLGGALSVASQAAQAAPKQFVVVVADGLSPQAIEMGGKYIKGLNNETTGEEGSVALTDFTSKARTVNADKNAFESLRGVLAKAAAKGYRTGFVTTGSVAADAANFYDLSDGSAKAVLAKRPFDFAAGGGRIEFKAADVEKEMKAAGDTVLLKSEDVENAETELKGKTLVLTGDAALPYATDVDPEKDVSLSALSGMAIDKLAGENDDKPYVLIVHDHLLGEALATKDTPAMLEELRELDGIIGEVSGRREVKEKPEEMAIALVATGGASAPKFISGSATDRSNALYIASQLPYSYKHVGELLQGANEERLTTFTEEEYKGWKLSADKREAIVKGTLNGEVAVRESYEPAIGLSYEAQPVQATIYTLGLDGDTLGNAFNTLPAVK